METLAQPQFPTSEATEKLSCSNDRQPNWTVEMIRDAIADRSQLLLDVFRAVGGIPASGIGILCGIQSLLQDLRAAEMLQVPDAGWRLALQDLHSEVYAVTLIDDATDRLAAKSLGPGTLQLFLLAPDSAYSTQIAETLSAAKGIVLMKCLADGKPPAKLLCDAIAKLFSGRTLSDRTLASNLVLEKNQLENLRGSCLPGDNIAMMVTTLIISLEGPVRSPPRPERASLVVHIPESEGEQVRQSKSDPIVSNNASDLDAEDKNLMARHASQLAFAHPRTFSGIHQTFNQLASFELDSAFALIVPDLDSEREDEALGATVTFLARCRPKRFNQLPLQEVEGIPFWYEVETGHLCWILNYVTDRRPYTMEFAKRVSRNDLQVIRIPFPKKVVHKLRQKFRHRPGARTAGDLFEIDLELLDARTAKYVEPIGKTSHRITLERLESSFARYLLPICKDEAYAAAVGMDFSLGTISNFNYMKLRAQKINAMVAIAYRALSFPGAIENPVTNDVGAQNGMRIEEVDDMMTASIMSAHEAYTSFPRRPSLEQIWETQQKVSQGIGLPTVVTTGRRAAKEYGLTRHTVDLDLRLASLSDKHVSSYQHTRIVPLPEEIVAWIRFYMLFTQSQFHHLLSKDPQAAALIWELLTAENATDPGPLFFSHVEGRIQPMGTKDLAPAFAENNLPTNAGRHWVDDILREDGCDSAVIMAWQGHGCAGQEAYGSCSALSPALVNRRVASALDKKLASLNWPKPPVLDPDRYQLPAKLPYRPSTASFWKSRGKS